MRATKHHSEFVKVFRRLCYRWNPWEVWSDWLIMASCALYQPIHQDPEVEAEYMRAVSRYSREEADTMAQLLALTVDALEAGGPHDFLGGIFHELEMHNEARGQFFTPYELCRMMARMVVDPQPPPPGRALLCNEPACGSGATMIAIHEIAAGAAEPWAHKVHYVMQDLDDRAFRMAYIQASLLGMSAEVVRGNTLAMDFDSVWRTPGYYVHGMRERMLVSRMLQAFDGAPSSPAAPVATPEPDMPAMMPPPPSAGLQLSLF